MAGSLLQDLKFVWLICNWEEFRRAKNICGGDTCEFELDSAGMFFFRYKEKMLHIGNREFLVLAICHKFLSVWLDQKYCRDLWNKNKVLFYNRIKCDLNAVFCFNWCVPLVKNVEQKKKKIVGFRKNNIMQKRWKTKEEIPSSCSRHQIKHDW